MKLFLLITIMMFLPNVAQAEEYDIFELIALNRVSQVADRIDNGLNVDTKDEDGMTLLARACMFKTLDVAKLLVKKGADINAVDNDKYSIVEGCTLKPYINKPEPVVDYLKSIGAQ